MFKVTGISALTPSIAKAYVKEHRKQRIVAYFCTIIKKSLHVFVIKLLCWTVCVLIMSVVFCVAWVAGCFAPFICATLNEKTF
jgi:hypothetical protein